MSDEERTGQTVPIAALLFGPDDHGRDSQCAHCRSQIHLHSGTVDMAKSWNRRQVRLEREGKPYERPLQYNELSLCDACYRRWQLGLEEQARLTHETARFYLQQLREDCYTGEILIWLRSHGYGREVDDFLARQMKGPTGGKTS